MDGLSVLFGFIVGLICGMSMALERYYHWLEKERKGVVKIKTTTPLVMFVPKDEMKDYRFVGVYRTEPEDK